MLCWAGQAAWCAGQACCNLLWMTWSECGANKKVYSKIGYLFISLVCILISILMLFYAKDILDKVSLFIECPEGGSVCMGISAVYRMSLTLAFFHLVMLTVISISKIVESELGSIFNDGCWALHILMISTIFILSLYIPNEYVNIYGYLSRFLSIFFLIFQGICILSIAYKMNEVLVGYHTESGTSLSLILLLGITISIYIFDAVFLYLLIKWFSGCAFNIYILILLIVMIVIFTIWTVFQTRENASILTNAIVMSYLLYLSWSAMASEPDGVWNPFVTSNSNTVFQIVLGFVFTSVSILSISIITKTGDNSDGFRSNWAESDEDNHLSDIEVANNKMQVEDSYIFPLSYATIFFHIIMIFACCYYSMLLSNWGDPTINNDKATYFKANEFSMWAKLVSQFACYAIFLWSLIGPLILPDRDWEI